MTATTLITAPTVITGEATLSPGWVRVAGEQITAVGEGEPPLGAGERVEAFQGTVIPGMVDIHCHGGGGAAFTDGPTAAIQVVEAHLAHGTTSMMASLVTDTVENLELQIAALEPLVTEGVLAGIHLEGPWLSRQFCGAHDSERLLEPVLMDFRRLATPVVRMVTLAPELPGALEALSELRSLGVVVAVGHTAATAAQARAALEGGASVVTHLFNAMRPVHHREPGPVWEAVRSAASLELISDGVHLHPTVLADLMLRLPQRCVLVTDAMAAAGASDGSYQLGPMSVTVVGGRATISGTDRIAGSSLTMDVALRYAVQEAGVPLPIAVRAATMNPAAAVGLTDRGRLVTGSRADLVALDDELQLTGVMRLGQWV